MTTDQKDLIAIVFDMSRGQLQAALYQIIMGDDLSTALDKARAKKVREEKYLQEGFLK